MKTITKTMALLLVLFFTMNAFAALQITPDSVELSLYGGESKDFNVSVTNTFSQQAHAYIFFNIQNDLNDATGLHVFASDNNFLLSQNQSQPITIHVESDTNLSPGAYQINLWGTTDLELQGAITQPNNSGGGGGEHVTIRDQNLVKHLVINTLLPTYREKTVTVYQDRNVVVTEYVDRNIIQPVVEQKTENALNWLSTTTIILVIIIIALLTGLVLYLTRNKNKGDENGKSGKETQPLKQVGNNRVGAHPRDSGLRRSGNIPVEHSDSDSERGVPPISTV